jgi:hypothetical protein
VVDNLEERVMSEFLSWVRYVEFDGDLATLYLAKNEAILEYQKKRDQNRGNQDEPDSDDRDLDEVFKGT